MTTGTLIEIKTGQWEPWHLIQAAIYAWLIGKNWDRKAGKLITENPDFRRVDHPSANEHRYVHAKAKRVFAVTDVCRHLRNWEYFDRSAADEGAWIHKAIGLIDQGEFTYNKTNAPNISDEVWGKLEAYKKFLKQNHQFTAFDINEIPLCAPLENKGTYIAGTFDKYIPGGWPLGVVLLYLRADATYKIVPVGKNKLSSYMMTFRHALACCEFAK